MKEEGRWTQLIIRVKAKAKEKARIDSVIHVRDTGILREIARTEKVTARARANPKVGERDGLCRMAQTEKAIIKGVCRTKAPGCQITERGAFRAHAINAGSQDTPQKNVQT